MKKKKICVNGIDYEIIRNDSECFYDDIIEKITDYFIPYDYIVGDFSYDMVRLKGFYDDTSNNVKHINNYKYLDSYINNYCSFGANIFVLKKLK